MTDEAARAMSLRLKWRMADARALIDDLEQDGVHVTYVPTTGDLCPQCATHYATEDSGFCVKCTTEMEVERRRIADEAEEARLREEAERIVNQQKKARERMRDTFDANPRKKTLAKWVDELAQDRDRFEAFVNQVNAKREEISTAV